MQQVLKYVVDAEAQPAKDGDGVLAAYLVAAHRLRKAQLATADGEQPAAAQPAALATADAAAAPAASAPEARTDGQAAAPAPAPAPGDPPAGSSKAEGAGEQAAAQAAAAQPASKRRKVGTLQKPGSRMSCKVVPLLALPNCPCRQVSAAVCKM